MENFNGSNAMVGKGRLYYGWIVLAACLIISIVGFGIQVSFGVFFKSLEADFGLTRALTSAVFSVFLLLCPVFGILGGWLLDRYGPRLIVILMGFFTGLSLLLTSQANTLWHLFMSYSLLLAVGTGPLFPVLMSIVSRWFIKGRGLALGIVGSGISIGTMVVPPVSAYLIAGYGWRMSYAVLGLVGFFVITPLALLQKGAPGKVAALSESERLEAVNLNSTEEQAYNELGDFSTLQATKARNFWLIFFMWFLCAFCVYIITTHIVRHAIDLGTAPTGAATILSVVGGISILGRVAIGRVSDIVGRKQAVVSCGLLMAGAMLWLIWSSNLWMLYLFAAIFGFSYGGFTVPITALIGDTFGLRNLGVIMAVLGAGWGIGGALGPAFAGYIFDIRGNYFFAFLAGMLAMLVATGLLLIFKTIAKTGDRVVQ